MPDPREWRGRPELESKVRRLARDDDEADARAWALCFCHDAHLSVPAIAALGSCEMFENGERGL